MSDEAESLAARIARRSATLPVLLFATLTATLLAPLSLPLALLASLGARYRGAARTAAFVLCYLWCETAGVAIAFWLWLRHGFAQESTARYGAFLAANYRLQCGWSNALKRSAEAIFRLTFTVEGDAALDGRGALVLPRHASMADTIIPMVFYAIPHRVRLRYVLKRELLLDPCLDIVGHRLPNCFVDRDADDSAPEIARIAALANGLDDDEGVLIYPEGTRFSPERRARVLARLEGHVAPTELERMTRWRDLLPPRLGGALALLDANPGRDVVFCAHTGFEGATHFASLIGGGWTGAHVRVRFWRVRYADVPKTADERRAFLFAAWDAMQETVDELRSGESPWTNRRSTVTRAPT